MQHHEVVISKTRLPSGIAKSINSIFYSSFLYAIVVVPVYLYVCLNPLFMKKLCLFCLFWFCLSLYYPLRAQLPALFHDQLVGNNWGLIVGLTFDANGRMYVWDKGGKVYIVENGQRLEEPLLDISEEVMNHGDHGMLGFALHPNFLNNGYFYVLYVVDQHHLLYHGTSQYSPDITSTEVATIGRLTRYTADAASGFTRIVPGSRNVLIGERIDAGIPMLHKSHGVGALVFATDGSLMVSCGDGASFVNSGDFGSHDDSFYREALELGIITEAENVGAFRSQMLNSLNGKLLRIDPNTGDGLSSNPFFEAANPRSARSRVWALGFRNPYRFTLKPGTGSHDPSEGNPGVFYVGDVGWAEWEEINVVKQGGQNFGWPIYEGNIGRWQAYGNRRPNPEAPNPLYGQPGCDQPFIRYNELLLPETLEKDPFWPNPCDPSQEIPDGYPKFTHTRPMLCWSNSKFNQVKQGAEVPDFDEQGNPIVFDLNDPDAPAKGESFAGSCTVGGVFYTGHNFPDDYLMSFIAADYPGWMRKLLVDPQDRLLEVSPFLQDTEDLNIVHLEVNPVDGCLYYISYAQPTSIHKICYGGNPPPVSVLQYDRQYGSSPLQVQFRAEDSYDPEGQPLSFFWDFGDGSSSTLMNPLHTFTAGSSDPLSFEVTLRVTDSLGASAEKRALISLNNTPPQVRISSFEDGNLYEAGKRTLLPLMAEVKDNEHSHEELHYEWQVFFHHNTHNHREPVQTRPIASAILGGEGCGDEAYWYRIGLRVTDPVGLATYTEGEIFPYCDEPLAEFDNIQIFPETNYFILRWSMLQQYPAMHFVIERASDDFLFMPLGEKTANMQTPMYAFIDNQPLNGLNVYRIAIVHANGLMQYAEPVEANFPPPAFISLFPNPAGNEVFVHFRNGGYEASFVMYNELGSRVLGRKIKSNELIENTWKIELDNLPAGLYFYQVRQGKRHLRGKLLKQ